MLAGFFLFGGNIGERFTKRAQSFQHLVPLGLMGLARTPSLQLLVSWALARTPSFQPLIPSLTHEDSKSSRFLVRYVGTQYFNMARTRGSMTESQ